MSEADKPPADSQALTQFLRDHREEILRRWSKEVLAVFQSKGVGHTSSRLVLDDGMEHFLGFLLDHIDRGVEFAGTQQTPDAAPSTDAAFSFTDVLRVQAQLKNVVRAMLAKAHHGQPEAIAGLQRTLEQAINETTLETASLYYQMSEYELRESRKETQQVAAICRMTTAIISSLDRRELCRATARELPGLFPFKEFRLALLHEDQASLRQFLAEAGSSDEPVTRNIELADASSYQWVIANRKPHVAKNIAQHAQFFDDAEELRAGMNARMVIPIVSRDETLGVLDLVHTQAEAYSERDIPVMWQIASQLGVALHSMRLLAAERKRAAQLHIVSEVARHLGKMAIEDLLKLAARAMQESFDFYDVSIFLLSSDRQELVLTAQAGAYEDLAAEGYRQAVGVGMVGWVAEHGEMLLANDVAKEPRRIVAFEGENVAGSEMCMPIKVEGEVAGVINIESTEIAAFDIGDCSAIETISQEIGTSIQWSRLRAERAQAEREAAEARKQLDYIGRSISLGIAATDMDGLYTHWGSGSERLTGYTAGEVVGHLNPADLIRSSFDLKSTLERCTAESHASDEVLIETKDERHIWVQQVWVNLRDDAGRRLGFACYMEDVTQRREAETALRREKQKLDNVMDVMGAGLCIIDESQRITWANRTLLDWLETDEATVLSSVCCQVFTKRDQRCVPCNFELVRQTGKPRTVEQVMTSKSGVTRYLQHVYAPLPDESGKVTNVIKLTQDVTQNALRVQQLSLLHQLGQEMQSTLDIDRLLYLVLTCITAGHHGLGFNRALLFLVDDQDHSLQGRMAVGPTDASDAMRSWREIEEQRFTLYDLAFRYNKHRHESSPLQRLTRDTQFPLDEQGNFIVDCVRRRKPVLVRSISEANPSMRPFLSQMGAEELVCVPLVTKDRAVGVVLADNRFTQRPIGQSDVQLLSMFATQAGLAIDTADAYRKLEDQMRQLDQAHEDLMRAERLTVVGELAAHVAHEIRNPLVTIGGFARATLRQEDLSDRVRRGSQIIVQEVERLERILKSVMDFTKPSQPVKRRTCLSSLVAEVVDELRPMAHAEGTAITFEHSSGLDDVALDPDQIKQALINIIKNAIEAVAARHVDAPTQGPTPLDVIHVRAKAQDGSAVVWVTDHGTGMSSEVLENIFDPFYTIKVGGTGLGLAITRKIVTDHAGSIRVESEEGVGSTFEVSLPLPNADPAAQDASAR